MNENRVRKYFLYAVGEIILVIFGILIALQINNQNDLRKLRNKEVHYLENIKADLINYQIQIGKFMTLRSQYISSAQTILGHFEGVPIDDWGGFNEHCLSIYTWKRFYSVNYTFEELIYSGNLAMITNDSIKVQLLNLESLYKQTKAEEDHYRFDSEEIIYKPIYSIMDLSPVVTKAMDPEFDLNRSHFYTFFEDFRIKNGFLMSMLEFTILNEQLQEMHNVTELLIALIDLEIAV